MYLDKVGVGLAYQTHGTMKMSVYYQILPRVNIFPRLTKFVRVKRTDAETNGSVIILTKEKKQVPDINIRAIVGEATYLDAKGNPIKDAKYAFGVQEVGADYVYLPDYIFNKDIQYPVTDENGYGNFSINLVTLTYRANGKTGKMVKSTYPSPHPIKEIYTIFEGW